MLWLFRLGELIEWNAVREFTFGALTALWVMSQSHPQQVNGRQIVIRAGFGNACHADLTVNDHAFSVLLDSGATGSTGLVFGKNHARALGYDPDKLSYSYTYGSANGDGKYASVTLRSVRLQSFVVRDVPAQITAVDQSEPLFGAKFLHALQFQTKAGNCYLTVPEAARVAAH
jgi:clan AA aspartic protease (TIGR02281 family)